jgi:protein gp37
VSATTKIEWTDTTWNPVTGCTEVSPGCDNCYAKTLAERFRGTPGHYFEQGFDVVLRPDKLAEPLKWRKPRRVFDEMSRRLGPEIAAAIVRSPRGGGR